MTIQDDVNRILRDHEGYTGDGKGGVGALPIGDPATPVKPISKRDLREALIDTMTGIDQAVTDAETARDKAQEWAESPTAPGGPGTKSSKTSAQEAAVEAGNASASAQLAQDWAEKATAPGGVGTKSAKTWAGEAAQSASDAENTKNELLDDLTVTATTLNPGQSATATWDGQNQEITFGIPRGADGQGTGDMLAATYDPNGVADDAFSMDNMVEGSTTKIMTNAERMKLAGIATGADVTPDVATLPEFASATASRVYGTTSIWGNLAALTDAATIAVNLNNGYDFGGSGNAKLNLGGNRTLGSPTNGRTGKKGVLWFGASGSTRTLTLHADWKLADGAEEGPYSITTSQTLGVAYVCLGSTVVVTAIVRF